LTRRLPWPAPHSFRRANITWRQEVGGSAIEASKIAGHADLEMTGEYTFVAPERQNELTRRIQERLAAASKTTNGALVDQPAAMPSTETGRLADLQPTTSAIQ